MAQRKARECFATAGGVWIADLAQVLIQPCAREGPADDRGSLPRLDMPALDFVLAVLDRVDALTQQTERFSGSIQGFGQ